MVSGSSLYETSALPAGHDGITAYTDTAQRFGYYNKITAYRKPIGVRYSVAFYL
jgi:hypothetical protein